MKTQSLALLAAILMAGPALAADTGRQCDVAEISGPEATLWRFGDEVGLVVGALAPGEGTITTGSTTRVEIRCDGGVVITIGVDTRVALESLVGAAASDNVILQILDGIVGAVAPARNWKGFELRSPLAIAAIRSTEWFLQHDSDTGSAVFVREGRVEVSAPRQGRAFALAPGEGVDVTPTDAGPVRTWGAARVEAAGERLGFGWR